METTKTVEVHCDGWCEHANPVTHIDRKGYAYCTPCGLIRRQYQPCRKLQGWELRKLQRGEQLARY